jgi:hypothetical protein
VGLLLLALLAAGVSRTASAATLEARYPGLAKGLLCSAVLVPLAEDTLLEADGISITRPQLLAGIQDHEPKLQVQLGKNLLFVLEQEAMRQILLKEAQKAGIPASEGDESRVIQAFFESQTKSLAVSETKARAFYAANKDKDYPEKLNVVFIHVGGVQVLAARYGIRPIPVQVFFDAEGREVFRHVGFFAQDDVNRQLAQMGVAK